MWLFENENGALNGKRLWLRPGKRYLFGRTVAEPGMLAITGEKSNSISRKHITIEVEQVRQGDSQNLSSRSHIVVEDLGSKIGTVVNGQKIKGEKYVITQESNELKMGNMAGFRITWFPVVLSFSFTKRELQGDVMSKLRSSLEQLDVKFISDYDVRHTTHVVSKKRNTSKGLQALINSKHIVDDKFVDAIVSSASSEQIGGGVERSPLEADFDQNWPNAMQFLPQAGNEPVTRPSEAFAPNSIRADIFDGYTFIFYDETQYETLLGPITNARGKALYKEVVPEQTRIDDFILYVKSVAGEKGLGEFEDGSEGKGVVVVRFLPKDMPWYEEFYREVSLRLDHRLIDQKDFLDAILGLDASVLRRPLEVEIQLLTAQPGSALEGEQMEIDNHQESASNSASAVSVSAFTSQPSRRRPRGIPKSRFKGFVADSDSDGDNGAGNDAPMSAPPQLLDSGEVESSQEGLFVSQDAGFEEPEEVIQTTDRRPQRKRPAFEISRDQDITEDFAPTAAQMKRRRIAAGEEPVPRQLSPAQEEGTENQISIKASPKIKKEFDIMEIARKNREEVEERARAEREDLAIGVEHLDLAEIRRLQIEEPMEVRGSSTTHRTRDQDVADGRWDPSWNGRKNFKKFQQRGAASPARPPQRIIVPLEEVKNKGYGIGDEYWLEDEGRKGKAKAKSKSQPSQDQSTYPSISETSIRQEQAATTIPAKRRHVDDKDSSESEIPPEDSAVNLVDDPGSDDDVVIAPPPKKRAARAKASQSLEAASTRSQQSARTQSTTQTTQTSTRVSTRGTAPPPRQPERRSKVITVPASDDDEDSEDELRFRFRKR
ncbi:hypothetical protein BX600DRAFT_66824 [Xylariales sp. PMI_506]|nr:hypothetical protein BX600DRAFT_66824 [Xylariales sp. PMI_506]